MCRGSLKHFYLRDRAILNHGGVAVSEWEGRRLAKSGFEGVCEHEILVNFRDFVVCRVNLGSFFSLYLENISGFHFVDDVDQDRELENRRTEFR